MRRASLFDEPYVDATCPTGSTGSVAGIPLGTVGDRLTFSSSFDGWGYVHLFDRAPGAPKMKELDTYAGPEAHDAKFADGFGDLSVHEVATSQVDAAVADASYYAARLRVVDIGTDETGENAKIVEKAAHIAAGGNNFWGVETFSRNGKE